MQMHKVIGSLWRQRRMGTRNEPCGAPQKSIYPQGKQKVHKEYINDIKQLKSSVRLWELEEVNSEAWQLLHFNFHFSQTLQQLISADLHSLNLRSNQQNNLQLLRSIGKLFMPKQMLWLTEKFLGSPVSCVELNWRTQKVTSHWLLQRRPLHQGK